MFEYSGADGMTENPGLHHVGRGEGAEWSWHRTWQILFSLGVVAGFANFFEKVLQKIEPNPSSRGIESLG